ncbi:MAG: glycosyltransferase [Candidatus Thermoplasmatota archaeon]|nr:glycosyltransferase [Candidatus Thermoplasmatota archaeon]
MGTRKGPRVSVVIIAHNREKTIASTVLLLRHLISDVAVPDIVVMDNGSTDRTPHLVTRCGARAVRYSRRMPRKDFIRRALQVGKESSADLLLILDILGDNTAEDANALVRASIEEGSRFTSAFVKPVRGDDTIGCWAISGRELSGLDLVHGRVEEVLMDAARSGKLPMKVVHQDIRSSTKFQKKKLFNFPRGHLIGRAWTFALNNPFKFYGGLGLMVLLLSLLTGFHTVMFFYNNGYLSYVPALATIVLVMVGGFLMVAGLMLNALNVLVEKLEAMMRWM